jgi:hypothetical protein
MIPKGPIFAHLRTESLTFFPDDCHAVIDEKQTFGDWLESGSYVPANVSQREIVFDASAFELSSVVLADAERLLDHCFEHIQELVCFATDKRFRSGAWQVTTIYYLGFFTMQAFLRLVGRPMVFLDRKQLAAFSCFKAGGGALPRGAYKLKFLTAMSVTQSRYSLKPVAGRIHEATWNAGLGLLADASTNATLASNVDEVEWYSALTRTRLAPIYANCNFTWPSFLRNKANYRPGFAYRLLTGPYGKVTRGIHKRWLTASNDGVRKIILESAPLLAQTTQDLSEHVKVLFDFSLSLFILTREVYSELRQRRTLDPRWEQKRLRFARNMAWKPDEFPALNRIF